MRATATAFRGTGKRLLLSENSQVYAGGLSRRYDLAARTALSAEPKEEEMYQAAVAANAALVLRFAGPRTGSRLPRPRIQG